MAKNLPFFGEDVVDLHLVVTQQFACIGVENLRRQFKEKRSDVKNQRFCKKKKKII